LLHPLQVLQFITLEAVEVVVIQEILVVLEAMAEVVLVEHLPQEFQELQTQAVEAVVLVAIQLMAELVAQVL
jgi:hypothetical protein